MRVSDAADFGKRAIQHQMGGRVGAWPQIAFDDTAGLQRNDDHMVRSHRLIWHAGRFDHQTAAGAIHAAGVAPGLDDETLANQLTVASADFLFQLFKHGVVAVRGVVNA